MADKIGVNRLARWRMRDRLLVLCYHAVVPDDTPDDPRTIIAVTESQFEAQLVELRRHWRPIHEKDVLEACENSAPLPLNSVLITFDDGFRNNLEFAAPLLKKHGVPATFFVSSALIGSSELLWTQEVTERVLSWPEESLPHPNGEVPRLLPENIGERFLTARKIVAKCKTLPDSERRNYLKTLQMHEMRLEANWQETLYSFMTWDEVRELAAAGFSIGAHTLDHPILTRLTRRELARQLVESKACLECELERPCFSIAYPNGGTDDFSATVIELANQAGYRLGYTLCEQRNPENLVPMQIDRICVTRDVNLNLFRVKTVGWRKMASKQKQCIPSISLQ